MDELKMDDCGSSVKKPNIPARISRIALPSVRKVNLKENCRAKSTDRVSYIPMPSAITKRSMSATTPLRTPMRTPNHVRPRTPSNERNAMLLTCEKREIKGKAPVDDKEWIQQQTMKVVDKLRNIEGLSYVFVERENLKAMSTKDFVFIANHLFREIGGKSFKINGTNYIEDIARNLAQLDYPYSYNKSMLKTPNAPHSINNIIAMLGWLVDLAPFPKPNENFIKYMRMEEFPNDNFSAQFSVTSRRIFDLFNEKKDAEIEQVKENMANEISIIRVGKDLKGLEVRTQELEKELKELSDLEVDKSRKDSFLTLDQEFIDLQKTEKTLMESCSTAEKFLKRYQSTQKQASLKVLDLQNDVKVLKMTIECQKMSVKERDEIIMKLSYQQKVLNTKRNTVEECKKVQYQNEIQLSRLLKEKLSLISKLNIFLYKLSHDLQGILEVDCEPIEINAEDGQLESDLEKLSAKLSEFYEKHSECHRQLLNEKSRLENKCADRQRNILCVEERFKKLSNKAKELEQKRIEINEQIVSQINEKNAGIFAKKELYKEMGTKNSDLKNQIEKSQSTIAFLAMEMERYKEVSLKEIQDILDARKERCMRVGKVLRECEKIYEDMENTSNRD